MTGLKKPLPMYGVIFSFMYEIENFRADLDYIITGNTETIKSYEYGGNESCYFTMGSIGITYLFFKTDISPFVGVGLGYGVMEYKEEGDYAIISENPNKAYEYKGAFIPLKVGIEFFRLYDFRMIASVQANFSLENNQEKYKDAPKYSVPIFFSLSIAFDYNDDCCCS